MGAPHSQATTEQGEERLGDANLQGDQQLLDQGGYLVPQAGHLHPDRADLNQVEKLFIKNLDGYYRGGCRLTAEASATAESGEAVAVDVATEVVAEVAAGDAAGDVVLTR